MSGFTSLGCVHDPLWQLAQTQRQWGFVALARSSKIRRPQRTTNIMTKTKTLPASIGKVLKRLHYPLDVILLCVRWYVAYSL